MLLAVDQHVVKGLAAKRSHESFQGLSASKITGAVRSGTAQGPARTPADQAADLFQPCILWSRPAAPCRHSFPASAGTATPSTTRRRWGG
jgi:hypothetical protein